MKYLAEGAHQVLFLFVYSSLERFVHVRCSQDQLPAMFEGGPSLSILLPLGPSLP
jgi:hypothetical protein